MSEQQNRKRRWPAVETKDALDAAVARSARRSGLALPHSFLRDEQGEQPNPPLARILSGGGEVRLKLLLLAALIAVKPPFKYERQTPPSQWAKALGLDDAGTNGARRVSDAFAWLDAHDYLAVDRQRGRPPTFKLRSLRGTGKSYIRPQTPGTYMTVPLQLWERHWVTVLTGNELAVLLALLDRQRGKTGPGDAFFLTGKEKRRYGLSDDTWTRATKGLRELGLLSIHKAPQEGSGGWEWTRIRNSYLVDIVGTMSTQASPIAAR